MEEKKFKRTTVTAALPYANGGVHIGHVAGVYAVSYTHLLSMYKDPEQREQQIRNMSQAFRELADGIIPELRRSRLIINYETIGRSDDQIKEQYAADATKLSADEMLYYASLVDNQAEKEEIYKLSLIHI